MTNVQTDKFLSEVKALSNDELNEVAGGFINFNFLTPQFFQYMVAIRAAQYFAGQKWL